MKKRYDRPPLLELTRPSNLDIVNVDDFIYISKDVSNSNLVTTSEGDVLVNAGTLEGGGRHKKEFASYRRGKLPYAIITQGHPDHFGGLADLKEDDTEVIMQANNPEVRDYWSKLGPFYGEGLYRAFLGGQPGTQRDTSSQWGNATEQPTDILFRDEYSFSLGDRDFELHSTPGGETTDSCIVWMPNELVVFTGNLFGPMWVNVPFINTLRGDRIRSVVQYIADVEKVRALKPEILITGHGDPIRGADLLQEKLVHLRDAVQFIHDYTIDGMNAGKDVYTLMRDIQLPDGLELGQGHGKIAWAVRGIFTYYNGWYDRTNLADMYHLPLRAMGRDLIELGGGPDGFVERAGDYVKEGEPLEALHLTDLVLQVEDDHRGALAVRKEALEILLDWSGNENMAETMQLTGAIQSISDKLASES
ncbi:MAG: MBL fold metallo-hydrolase [Gammaproteobacteria bacterium]|jgi:alkyl sulfatase BDS1-like metallo-beta-lactamase superfamily hydrolase|nr:MBL fold metallo-hydrolase [Gammaproteobacteria bacterium]MBT4492632.1 MBL fold metallo-hydrolase [Gammaproteobacteria bacterium]MBT7370758.1 MBL fold metallo-hydrolase [Gammaproteobacteria bacterium]